MKHRVFPLLLLLLAGPAQAGITSQLSVTKTDDTDPVAAGANFSYTLTFSNEGPSDALNANLNDPLPAGVTFVSLAAPGGWSCTTPMVGATGTVDCTNPLFAVGSAVFTVTVRAVTGPTLTNTVTVTSDAADSQTDDNVATEITTVGQTTGSITLDLVDSVDPVGVGAPLSFTVTGSSSLAEDKGAELSFFMPAEVSFNSLTAPMGWSCLGPAVGQSGNVVCTAATFSPGSAVLVVNTTTLASLGPGSFPSSANIRITSGGRDLVASDSETTAVVAPAALAASKTVSGDFTVGGVVTYVITVSNAGPASQFDNAGPELTDTLPTGLSLLSAVASAGTLTVAGNTLDWNGTLAANASFTITATARILGNVPPGTLLSNSATLSYDGDGDGTNEATASSDDPGVGGTADPTTFTVLAPILAVDVPAAETWGLVLLTLLLVGFAWPRLGRG